MRDFFGLVPWLLGLFVATAIVGFFAGAWYGYNRGEDALATRKEIREQCIAGSELACKVYEWDYTRGVL